MTAQLVVAPEEFEGHDLTVAGDPYRHLFRARRLAQGDRLRIVDGAGRARWGRVAAVDRSSARVVLEEPAPSHEPDYRLELLVAMPRRERASWLVEKTTELGVAAIRWLSTDRAPRLPGDGLLERFRRVSVAALEQSGRSCLPEITGPHSWSDLSDLVRPACDRWWLDAQPVGGSGAASGWRPTHGPGAVIVGPEGGWSDDEASVLRELGFRPVWLGYRVLRVETAAVVATAGILADPSRPR